MTSLLFSLLGGLWRRASGTRNSLRAERDLERVQALERAGDRPAARRAYEDMLAVDPACAVVHHRLGVLCAQESDHDAAVAHLWRAVTLDPNFRDAHIDLGNVYRMRDETDAAIAQYRRAIAIDPHCGIAHHDLGALLKTLRRFEEAFSPLQRAVECMPDSAGALRDYVYCLIELSRFDEATSILERQLNVAPNDPQLRVILGYAYQRKQEPEIAVMHYQAALALGADVAELHSNLGIVLQDLGRIDEALAHYARTLVLQPRFPFATYHRALARLLKRDFGAWHDYEARLTTDDHPRRRASYPRWDGSRLDGTLLVYSEQGLGDEIMFASCLPDAIGAVRHCVVECAPKLEGLFRRSFPAATVYACTPDRNVPEPIRALAIDCEVPAGSLPLYYRPTVSAFPAHAGYLKADAERTEQWRSRLAALGPGVKVGISWRGGVHKTRRSLRSIAPEHWSAILQLEDARFVSLQYDATMAEIQSLDGLARRHGTTVAHWAEAVDDYEDTAALVTALDLVISVCTAVIHLAGAIGRPAWVMTPYSPEWRYGFSGTGMPWYPSVRLYRQPAFGAWNPVIEEVACDLRAAAASTDNVENTARDD